MLDTGLDPGMVVHRSVRYFDYSREGNLTPGAALADPTGHGSQVIKILDEILPPDVQLVVGRLPADPSRMTTLTVAHALGDLVARTEPTVVNLSVAPMDNLFYCPTCRQRVPTPNFLSNFLSLIFRLAGRTQSMTTTVMAAGNSGQVPNSRWLNQDTDSLLLAVAENRRRERTSYSGSPGGPLADLFSASTFGGDDPTDPDAIGVFDDGTHGTSFAAPFLTGATLLRRYLLDARLEGSWEATNVTHPAIHREIGCSVQMLINLVRGGYLFDRLDDQFMSGSTTPR